MQQNLIFYFHYAFQHPKIVLLKWIFFALATDFIQFFNDGAKNSKNMHPWLIRHLEVTGYNIN
jgi:hypothetical protein